MSPPLLVPRSAQMVSDPSFVCKCVQICGRLLAEETVIMGRQTGEEMESSMTSVVFMWHHLSYSPGFGRRGVLVSLPNVQVANLLISPDDQISLIILAQLDQVCWVPYALPLNKGRREPREGVNKNSWHRFNIAFLSSLQAQANMENSTGFGRSTSMGTLNGIQYWAQCGKGMGLGV